MDTEFIVGEHSIDGLGDLVIDGIALFQGLENPRMFEELSSRPPTRGIRLEAAFKEIETIAIHV